MIGAAAAALALIGTGFLNDNPFGNIALWVQELGWGEQDLAPPITHAYIDLELKKVRNPGTDGIADTADDYFNNLIHACSFHSDQDIEGEDNDPRTETLADALIICKLTDENNNAISEGKLVLNGEEAPEDCPQQSAPLDRYDASDKILIEMCQFAFPNSNEVQEVHDVKIIVEGVLQTMRSAPPQ